MLKEMELNMQSPNLVTSVIYTLYNILAQSHFGTRCFVMGTFGYDIIKMHISCLFLNNKHI